MIYYVLVFEVFVVSQMEVAFEYMRPKNLERTVIGNLWIKERRIKEKCVLKKNENYYKKFNGSVLSYNIMSKITRKDTQTSGSLKLWWRHQNFYVHSDLIVISDKKLESQIILLNLQLHLNILHWSVYTGISDQVTIVRV